MHDGADWVAILGAVTGVTAFIWNFWRDLRQGARLEIDFYVFHENTDDPAGRPGAMVDISNAGNLPAYIRDVRATEELAWHRRYWPIRGLSSRKRGRWWLKWALDWPPKRLIRWSNDHAPAWFRQRLIKKLDRPERWQRLVRTDVQLGGRLDPGEMRRGRLVDIINDQPEPMEGASVERILERRDWLVVETGIRQYTSRVVDVRPENPQPPPARP
jgi:hypothetical protein